MKNILKFLLLCAAFAAAFAADCAASEPLKSQWFGKRVAFLGDSITDKIHVGTTKNYWQYLGEILGITPVVYGINGNTYAGVLEQAKKLKSESPENIDAIVVFAGTNDFNGGVPIGQWYVYADAPAPVEDGKTQVRRRRMPDFDGSTFKGRINKVMAFLQENFADKRIILLTPIHRGYANFAADNVQPDESFPNRAGLYIDAYVDAVKEAGNVWAVPVIDLNSVCGLYPNAPSHAKFFANKDTDLLHPNALGHLKIARAMASQMLAYPAD